MNLAQLLRKAALVYPQRRALSQGDTHRTYAELDARATRIAAGLEVGPGERVVIWSENRIEFVEALFATWRAGAVPVPLNYRLTAREVEEVIADADASLLLTGFEDAPDTIRVVDIADLPLGSGVVDHDARPEDLAWLFYTSGTTGRSKGACLSHGNLAAMTVGCLADICNFQPEDVVLHAAPLSHGSGMHLLPSLARGATNVMTDHGFEPRDVIELVERERVSAIAFLAPTMIVKLLDDPAFDPDRLSSLRTVIYGGGPMYVEHLKRAIDALGPVWVQLFGQGESPMTGTYLRREEHRYDTPEQEQRLASIGIPRTNVELAIEGEEGEPGEIILRGPTVMSGYWRNAAATAETLRDGWLHTGDVGYRDADGYVYLVDRLKDMIISGGSNVYAREVEEVLLTHPSVREVAVVGLPDPYWGEIVHAAVVVRGEPVPVDELLDHCAQRIASFKKPKSVEFVDELPKNAYGKVVKRLLRPEST